MRQFPGERHRPGGGGLHPAARGAAQRPLTAAPWLGQHSEEVLRSLGYGGREIEALFADEVVYDRYRSGDAARP